MALENPAKSYDADFPSNQRYSGFVDTDFEIKNSFKIHVQNFYINGRDYYVNDFVLGISYKYHNESGLWIKPFLGLHHTYDTYYKGWNGYMTGWVFNWPFELLHNSFYIFQWNEIEFARDKSFYEDENGENIGDGKSYGLNGSVALWWQMNDIFSSGVEYRYADHKLGSIEYQSAYIYTIKLNF